MIIQISKEVYDSLSDSEQQVINYLNENESSIPLMSITTIAEKTFTSPATVSRTIQKCGFRGISEWFVIRSASVQSTQMILM